MKRWPNFVKRVESNNGQLFLTHDLSQDDPYLLYAALQSGPSCDIFSRDLFRTHAHQLELPELRATFRKWQRVHQYSFSSPTKSEMPKIFIQPPVKYQISAHQNSEGYWHVPWTEEETGAIAKLPDVPFEVPRYWLCFKL